MDEQYKNHYIRTWLLGLKVTVNELMKGLLNRKASLAKWVMGGAMAFIFWAIVDPKNAIDSYGSASIKISISLFVLSFLMGVRVIWGETIGEHLAKSPMATKLSLPLDLLRLIG